MNRKSLFKIIGLIAVIGIAIAAYMYMKTTSTASDGQADFTIQPSLLIAEFEKDNKASNEKYVGKVIRFGGIVSEIEGDSALLLTLNTGIEDFSAKCGFNKSEFSKANKIESGDSIVVQGSCDGVDIPSDEMSLFGDKSISFSRCALFDTK